MGLWVVSSYQKCGGSITPQISQVAKSSILKTKAHIGILWEMGETEKTGGKLLKTASPILHSAPS